MAEWQVFGCSGWPNGRFLGRMVSLLTRSGRMAGFWPNGQSFDSEWPNGRFLAEWSVFYSGWPNGRFLAEWSVFYSGWPNGRFSWPNGQSFDSGWPNGRFWPSGQSFYSGWPNGRIWQSGQSFTHVVLVPAVGPGLLMGAKRGGAHWDGPRTRATSQWRQLLGSTLVYWNYAHAESPYAGTFTGPWNDSRPDALTGRDESR